MRAAAACRNALERASRRAAMRFLPVRSPTVVSTTPTKRCPGWKPSGTAAVLISRSTRVRSPEGASAGPCWSAKIAVRISWMVTSSSSTALPTPRRTSGTSDPRWALSSSIPVANSRWMTRSCRSRAIRSRSSYTASRSRSRCASAIISASAACEANWIASVRSSSLNGRSPRARGVTRAPMTRPPLCRGSAMIGPYARARALSIRGSVAASATNTGRPSRSCATISLSGATTLPSWSDG